MKNLFLSAALLLSLGISAENKTLNVVIANSSKTNRTDAPVVINLNKVNFNVRQAVVTIDGEEIASQIDDINGDGIADELAFVVDIDKKKRLNAKVELSSEGKQKAYEPRVYVDMMLTNKKIKAANKQDLYIDQLVVNRGTNPYWMLHHHGAAFESELVAYRIYFDHRQTVDIYAKYNKQLELKQTQFYPDEQQKKTGFGDDCLWVGNTLGVGCLRGFDGENPVMFEDLDHIGQKIVAKGPVRTIVEVLNQNWTPAPGQQTVTMKTYYTLYAGHRDCSVDVKFCSATNNTYCTGLINVKNSIEHSNSKGLRGCWGTDWPVSEKDSAGHKRETVGLGINIPAKHFVKEMPANKDNYAIAVKTSTKDLHYDIVFSSDNESFGFHSAKEWFAFLEEWKKELDAPVEVTIK